MTVLVSARVAQDQGRLLRLWPNLAISRRWSRKMDVAAALEGRFTCRRFLPKPVSKDEVAEILRLAGRAPSGGNLQPWQVWALSGEPLETLKARVRASTEVGQYFEGGVEHLVYPEDLKAPYQERRFRNGEAWYAALGIARDDMVGRYRVVADNFELFGAPVGVAVAIDRSMGEAQWADLGIFLQSLMLAARSRGLDSAPLASWTFWPKLVRQITGMPEAFTLYCIVALGHGDPDAAVNQARAERAPLGEWATFMGF